MLLQLVFFQLILKFAESHKQFYPGSWASLPVSTNETVKGSPGKRGPPGPPGSVTQCNCAQSNQEFRQAFDEVQNLLSTLQEKIDRKTPLKSCKQYKEERFAAENGIYTIKSAINANVYDTYCDFTADGGGWTLVASIHENNIGDGETGKCTVGDRWSSEQGNDPSRPRGDGNWQNRNVFGQLTAATSDDYKNQAYFELQAKDIMVWQVPNDTPLRDFNTSAYLQYRTAEDFLSRYGGNLFTLYNDYYPIVSGIYSWPDDNGPAIPVTFDRGDKATLLRQFPPNLPSYIDAGYIQFRAISGHQDAFAFCPGVRNKKTFEFPSQSCLGSTGSTAGITYCGDFSGLRHNGHPVGTGWSADQRLLTSTFLIFYR